VKPDVERDLAINVRPQAWEEPAESADLYQGVYLVTLNHLVDLRVFPVVDRVPWPPPLPDGLPITDAMTARRTLLAQSSYACVLDDALAGVEAAIWQFPRDDQWAGRAHCFFVGAAEHAALCRQLDQLVEATGGVQRTVAASSLGESPLTRLLGRLLASAELADDDRRALGR
jgi:hypothetical protein